ncbi:MAG: hypothetical protein HQL31_03115, partial [Planctomycetes bacterium]|nr:hypothetical protein [Planctomycetota bacterium]
MGIFSPDIKHGEIEEDEFFTVPIDASSEGEIINIDDVVAGGKETEFKVDEDCGGCQSVEVEYGPDGKPLPEKHEILMPKPKPALVDEAPDLERMRWYLEVMNQEKLEESLYYILKSNLKRLEQGGSISAPSLNNLIVLTRERGPKEGEEVKGHL